VKEGEDPAGSASDISGPIRPSGLALPVPLPRTMLTASADVLCVRLKGRGMPVRDGILAFTYKEEREDGSNS
jgi:hypothetical protein